MTADTPTADSSHASLLPADSKRNKPSARSLIVGFGLMVVCLIGIFTSPTVAVVGVWCVVLMIVMMLFSVPVAVALAAPSLIGVYAINGVPAAINLLSISPYNAVSSWSLSVLPMFIFMGMLLAKSGMTSRIYQATDRWFSWLPGGVGIGTTAAGAGLASVSGSTIGMTYALGRAGIPEMLRAGFDKRMALGTVIVSGLPGNLIPPSILLVVYAGIASVPVGPQLVAGAVPGILLAALFGLFIFTVGILAPRLVGRGEKGHGTKKEVTWKLRIESLRQIWGFPILMLVLFGGMFSGMFTPTEAGAAAALVALLLMIYYTRNDKPISKLAHATFATVSSTAAIFFILIGAEMLTRLMATTGLAQLVTDYVTSLGLSRVGFLLLLIVLYLFMGMFFETISMMMLTIPILLPTLEVMGISPLWFGVFVVLLGELAMITPPVGILSYIVHNISKAPEVNIGQNITLGDVFVAVTWFLPITILFLIIMIVFPEMTEWLPSLLERTSARAGTQ
ncbi:TRAP transporter large permease [Nesterenkonia muleiensis]|uniref:TRAP transporter large permease n=1 Tax=Nesterenkonia muleiensis TaxID=2282648 RepID=UPI000E76C3E6|nr:TRAP transporter large permease [Nesterenkonia muleiensis]